MGIHIAKVTTEKDQSTEALDYFGPGVTMAAKLACLAPRGSILISAEMYSKVMSSLDRYFFFLFIYLFLYFGCLQ